MEATQIVLVELSLPFFLTVCIVLYHHRLRYRVNFTGFVMHIVITGHSCQLGNHFFFFLGEVTNLSVTKKGCIDKETFSPCVQYVQVLVSSVVLKIKWLLAL